jgi:hypothetical protein
LLRGLLGLLSKVEWFNTRVGYEVQIASNELLGAGAVRLVPHRGDVLVGDGLRVRLAVPLGHGTLAVAVVHVHTARSRLGQTAAAETLAERTSLLKNALPMLFESLYQYGESLTAKERATLMNTLAMQLRQYI